MKNILLLIVLCTFCGLSHAQVATEEIAVISAPVDATIPDGVAKFQQDGLYGLQDYSTGAVVLPATYSSIREDSRGRFILVNENSKRGLYHGRLHKMILSVEYDDISIHDNAPYSDHGNDTSFVVVVEKNSRKGLHDHNGRTILEPEYDQISFSMSSSCAVVKKEGKKGVYFLNKTGRDIPVEYDDFVDAYPTRYFIGKKNGKYSLFDEKGNPVVTDQKGVAIYRNPMGERSSTKLIRIVNDQEKQGLYDSETARYIFPVKYEWIGNSYRGQFIVKQRGKYGLVNTTGKEIIPVRYDTLAFLRSRSAVTRLKAGQKHRYALITLGNKILTKFEYNDIETNGPLYTVKLDEVYSLIDSTGRRVMKATYDRIGSFHRGKSTVVLKNKSGYIDTNGVIVSPIDKPQKGGGFTTLDDLFKGFVKALKADNDTVLMAFCRQVVFDEGSGEFMKRLGGSYRGFPEKYGKDGYTIEQAVISYARYIGRFQQELRRGNRLASLRYVGMENDHVGHMGEGESSVLITESPGILSTDERTYEFKLGELIYLDGCWKSFTEPKWWIHSYN